MTALVSGSASAHAEDTLLLGYAESWIMPTKP